MYSRLRITPKVVFVFYIAMLLAACIAPVADSNLSDAQSRSDELGAIKTLTTIKVLQLPFLSFAPFFIAQEEGYFAEQGLTVEFVQMQQSTEAVPALLQGDLDVLAGFINAGLLNAMAAGEQLKVVADKGYQATSGCSAEAFILRSALADPGKELNADDLGNLVFSINRASVEGYYLDQLLAPSQRTLGDVHFETILNPAAELEAMQQGAIDLAIASEPWITNMTTTNAGVLWKSIGEVIPDFQSAVVVFGPRLLGKDSDLGNQFMAAYLKAVRQYDEGKTARNLEILAQYTKLDEKVLQATCWPQFREDGFIKPASIAKYAEWSLANGLLDQKVSEDQFWDARFVEYANQMLNK